MSDVLLVASRSTTDTEQRGKFVRENLAAIAPAECRNTQAVAERSRYSFFLNEFPNASVLARRTHTSAILEGYVLLFKRTVLSFVEMVSRDFSVIAEHINATRDTPTRAVQRLET